MKRYQFRMEQVLRVRRLQEDAAKAGVAVARQAERTAETAVEAATDHYRRLATAPSAGSTTDFLGLRDRVSLRATGLRMAEGSLHTAVVATAQAVDGWRLSHQRVEALERLDGRRREEYAIELRRFEDTTVDEIVVARARAGS